MTIFQIVPELLKACPELQPDWDRYAEWMKERGSATDFFSGAFLYLHIRNARTEGETEYFAHFFELLERLITDGNAEVKGIAVDGFLKGLHKSNLISIKPGLDAFAS